MDAPRVQSSTDGQPSSTLTIHLDKEDIQAIGRLHQHDVLSAATNPLLSEIRSAVDEQQFDVEFEFQDRYRITTDVDHAEEFVQELHRYCEDTTLPKQRSEARYMRDYVRYAAAIAHADAHVAELQPHLPDGVGHDAAVDAYTAIAERLQSSMKKEVKLATVYQYCDVDKSTGFDLGRALGATCKPDWDPSYIYYLYTPSSDDVVNTSLLRVSDRWDTHPDE